MRLMTGSPAQLQRDSKNAGHLTGIFLSAWNVGFLVAQKRCKFSEIGRSFEQVQLAESIAVERIKSN